MIQEFDVLVEKEHTNDKEWTPIAVEMSCVKACWAWADDSECTCVNIGGSDFVLRVMYKDFVDIWRTCTENINLNM